MQICSQCGSQNNPSSRFCTECGYSFQGLKGKILAKKKRITFQSKKMLETLKENVNNQITSYLDRLEEPDPHIGNVRIPDNRKDSIKNALMSFQQRIGSDSIQEVEDSPEFKEWLANLEHTIDTQKCNVCFMSWQGSETIVVCRHCQSGGHKDHLETWIKTRKMCPLCRREISLQDLASIDLSSNSK